MDHTESQQTALKLVAAFIHNLLNVTVENMARDALDNGKKVMTVEPAHFICDALVVGIVVAQVFPEFCSELERSSPHPFRDCATKRELVARLINATRDDVASLDALADMRLAKLLDGININLGD